MMKGAHVIVGYDDSSSRFCLAALWHDECTLNNGTAGEANEAKTVTDDDVSPVPGVPTSRTFSTSGKANASRV